MLKFLSLMSALSLVSVSLLTYSTQKVNAQQAQEYSLCYMTDASGEIIDLNYVCNGERPGDTSLKTKFTRKIRQLGIPIHYKNCKEAGLRGSYYPKDNKMVLCQNSNKSADDYVEVLAHESWHLVQDCVGGASHRESIPVSTGNPSFFYAMVDNLNYSDLMNLNLGYNREELPTEIEAFAMQKHPNLVLKALDACTNRSYARN
jgi:hypothetical protein